MKIKNWIKEHKIRNLVKNIIISILIVYFILDCVDFISKYCEYREVTNDQYVFESYLKDTQLSIEDHKESMMQEIIGYLKIDDYINNHPELLNLKEEEYNKLQKIVDNEESERKIGINEIKKLIVKNEESDINEYYKKSNYDEQTFFNILDLLDLEQKYGIYYFQKDDCKNVISILKNIKQEKNCDTDTIIQALENNNFDIISDYFNKYKYQYYSVKYPYSLQELELNAFNLTAQINNFIYSVIIGVFIGFIIYAYFNIVNIKKFMISTTVIVVIIAVIELFLLQNGIMLKIKIDNAEWGYSSENLHILFFNTVTGVIICVSMILCIVKIIMNKMRINKLNKSLNK